MTHILEEVSLRGLDHRALGGERLAQGFSGRLYHASSPPAAAALRVTKLPPEGSFLAKLAERKYMEPLLKGTGTLKVAPASKFDDRSLNPATSDNELFLTVKRPGREVSVRNADGGTFRPVGTVSFTTVTQSDYYVCCFAEALPLRLFDDFKSDSALVVHNPKEFFRRVDAAVKLKLGEGWKSRSGRVTYLDPYHSPPAAQVYFAKLFDFSYQREHRFVWLPPTSMKPGKLEFLYVNPGRLDDIGFLINI